MSKQGLSKKAKQQQGQSSNVTLPAILQGQTVCRIDGEKRSVSGMSVAEFDAWASSFVEEIVNVDRAVWDVFARWRFVNFLVAEDALVIRAEENGTILLVDAEVFSSAKEEA